MKALVSSPEKRMRERLNKTIKSFRKKRFRAKKNDIVFIFQEIRVLFLSGR